MFFLRFCCRQFLSPLCHVGRKIVTRSPIVRCQIDRRPGRSENSPGDVRQIGGDDRTEGRASGDESTAAATAATAAAAAAAAAKSVDGTADGTERDQLVIQFVEFHGLFDRRSHLHRPSARGPSFLSDSREAGVQEESSVHEFRPEATGCGESIGLRFR